MSVYRPRWKASATGFVAQYAGQWAGDVTTDLALLERVVRAAPNGDQIEIVTLDPQRIQRLRARGWRAPLEAVYVGRPTRWGNPFPVASCGREFFPRDDSVRMYRELVTTGETTFTYGGDIHRFARRPGPLNVPTVDEIRRALTGRDLICWCPLDVACHADVLLELANS